MNKKKIGLIAIVIIIIAVIIAFLLPSTGKATVQLDVTKAHTGNISTSVTATGTVEPIVLVEVGTQVSGVISKIYVDYNSVVKKGEILAELDKMLLQSELSNASASLQSKQVELNNQQRNYNRKKELWEKQAISKSDWEDAQTNYETAKLAVTSSQAAVVKAKTNLGYATIYSTIDGVVISRAVEEGQTVAASFSTPTLFTIANDLTKMRVIANVDEADIGEVKVGQHVTFTVDAYPNDTFEGEVMQVRLEATTTSNVVTYEVVINAPNPYLKLKPGLTANVSIFTIEENDVLLIPSKATRFNPNTDILKGIKDLIISPLPSQGDGKDRYVWIKSGNTISPKAVTLGPTDGINTVLLSGVGSDDEIVTGISQITKDMSKQDSNTSGETSPFMPKPPGGGSKKK